MALSQSMKQTITTLTTSISNIIDRKISNHDTHASSTNFGHAKAGGVPQTIGTSSSAGTDNGYYARADHVHTCSYNNLTNKPSSFTPSSHTHSISNITNLQSTLNDKADEEHTHSHEDISFTGSRETWQGLGSNKNIGQALDYLMYLFELNSFDINKVYPVGSIYISVNNTNPSTHFGGQWEQIKDKFLLAAGDTYTNGSNGGEASHTLTVNEMPSHNHGSKSLTGNFRPITYKSNPGQTGIVSLSGSNAADRTMSSGSAFGAQTFHVNATHTHDSNGGGAAHNNLPPYFVVTMWRRIA